MDQLSQKWNDEGFNSLDYAWLMCEMVDPYTSISARVTCESAIEKNMT